MKTFALFALSFLLILLVFQIFSLLSKKSQIAGSFEELQKELERTKTDQARLEREIDYLANPLNLEKEIRLRFNLKRPGEKMIIIVPDKNASSS